MMVKPPPSVLNPPGRGHFIGRRVMTAPTATAPLTVAAATVRVTLGQLFWWKTDFLWRQGPDTPDGYWMVTKIGRDAVRCIVDPEAPERTEHEFRDALCDARSAATWSPQDDYLRSLTIAAEIPLEELTRLRDAVRAGRAGGAVDGTPRKSRKAAAA
jgi:hypothetical protein